MRPHGLTILCAAALAGCGADGATEPAARGAAPPAAAAAEQPPASKPPAVSMGEPAIVSSEANIFGAGQEEPPKPGGGSGGILPVEVELPTRARSVRIKSVAGEVTPFVYPGEAEAPMHGAEGTATQSWEMPATGGISGLSHHARRMFLTGVFLTDGPPSGDAPRTLRYRKRIPPKQSPRIAQTFFMGDGRGRTFRVPQGATRIFLGFADYLNHKPERGPGSYENNRGELTVILEAR